MFVTKQRQAKNQSAATIGFWAAVVTAVLNLWYFLAFVPYSPNLSATWPDCVCRLVPAPALSGVDRALLFLSAHDLNDDDLPACLDS